MNSWVWSSPIFSFVNQDLAYNIKVIVSLGAVGELHPQIFRRTAGHPQILEKHDFYTFDFHDFHPSHFVISFRSISENIHPQFWNPNQDPAYVYNLMIQIESLICLRN